MTMRRWIAAGVVLAMAYGFAASLEGLSARAQMSAAEHASHHPGGAPAPTGKTVTGAPTADMTAMMRGMMAPAPGLGSLIPAPKTAPPATNKPSALDLFKLIPRK